VPQPDQKHLVVLSAAGNQWQVLVLLVVPVEEGELLLAVSGVVEGAKVQFQTCRRSLEGLDELIDQHVPQPVQVADGHRVLEP
jgi:hypothetical protein